MARQSMTAKDAVHQPLDIVEEPTVSGMAAGCETVAIVDKTRAEEVVEMGVREQMGHRTQLLLRYVISYGRLLPGIEHAAVDDDGFACLIADNITVLAERIDGKGFTS